ncbi:MAG: hypothetical protein K0U72_16965 [Gammaproteobacteria bacterium]|nr:hypothetical protein [Gammaproteobacteria bacterium]
MRNDSNRFQGRLTQCLCPFALLACDYSFAVEADIAWVSAGHYCEPETVLPLPDESLLVSNVCGFSKSGSGFLTLLDGDGQVLNWRIVDKLDSPLGMTMSGDRLYVVDNNRIKVFDWPGFKLQTTIEMGTTVANDVAVAADNTIYVTDSARHEVVRRSPSGEMSAVSEHFNFENANGIELFGSGLYVGGARLWRVDLQDNSVETVGPPLLADIDGIEFEKDGTLQVTPVGGPLIRYRSEEEIEILEGEGVSSANHGYSLALGLALIPTGYDNTVIAIRAKPRRP